MTPKRRYWLERDSNGGCSVALHDSHAEILALRGFKRWVKCSAARLMRRNWLKRDINKCSGICLKFRFIMTYYSIIYRKLDQNESFQVFRNVQLASMF